MTNPTLRCSLLAVALVLLGAGASRAEDGILGRILGFYRNRSFPVDRYAPGYYGYNLDDQSHSYYGGGRYTEYYAYGRGGGISSLANFPGPPPGASWLYNTRDWIGTQEVRPFAPPPAPFSLDTLPRTTARLTIRVPDNAVVWLEDQPTQQTGIYRQFISPPLEPGMAYTYTVRARWFEGGQQHEQVQVVPVRAGQAPVITFPGPSQAPGLLPAGLGQ